MATDPLWPPFPVPPVEPTTKLMSSPWILFFQNLLKQSAAAGSVTGTGTAGRLAKWLTSTSLTDALAAASSKLLGSGSSGSGAPYSEITLGTGLTMTGTTLSASGTGTVTTTGSPASGNLTKFSGATSITNGDLSGDVTTTSTLVTTIAANAVTTTKINAAAVTLAKIQNAAANSKVLGSGSSGSGAAYSELSLGTGLSMSGTTLSVTGGGTGVGGLQLIEQHTASSSATLDFTTTISASYDDYQFELVNVSNATNTQDLQMQVSTDGGATWFATNNYYYTALAQNNTSTTETGGFNGNPSTILVLAQSADNGTAIGVCGSVKLFNPGASYQHPLTFDLFSPNAAGVYRYAGMCYINLTTAVNAVRFKFASGNIASGTIRAYGYAK